MSIDDHRAADMPNGVVHSGTKLLVQQGDDVGTGALAVEKNDPQPQPRPEMPTVPAPQSAAAFSSPWRDYFDRLLGLCQGAAEPPSAQLFRPPAELPVTMLPRFPTEQGPAVPAVESESSQSEGCDCPSAGLGSVGTANTNGRGVSPPPTQPSDALVLLLVDMNGTLLYRAKKPLPIFVDGGDGAPAFVHGDPDPVQYYMRPAAAEFVAAMARHPRVRLAFYTSMRGVNAVPAARFLMSGGVNGAEADPEVYDRPFNTPDPEGVNPWDTTRNLPLIWSTPNRAGEGFGPRNTIMVDDTPKKMRFMDAGLVIVPEYTEASVIAFSRGGTGIRTVENSSNEAEDLRERQKAARRQAEVMPRLTDYMRRLLEVSCDDVRSYIANTPFRPHAPSDVAEDACAATPESARSAPPVSLASEKDEPKSATPATSGAAPAATTSAATAHGVDSSTVDLAGAHHQPSAPSSTSSKSVILETISGSDRGPSCFVEAVALLLTTGPLARPLQQTEAAMPAAKPATEWSKKASRMDPGRGVSSVGGWLDFDGLPRDLEESLVDAVTELLRAACAAARRWELPRAHREGLEAWSALATARPS